MKINLIYFVIVLLILSIRNNGFSQTKETLTDIRDKKVYKTVKIGNQTWMAENLDFVSKEGSCCYENKESNCARFGRLYTWQTANTVCPKGWHLSSEKEWNELADFYGGVQVAGKKLKGLIGWQRWDKGASKDNVFLASPGGNVDDENNSFGLGEDAFWWTSKEFSTTDAMIRNVSAIGSNIGDDNANKKFYLSVRCIKD